MRLSVQEPLVPGESLGEKLENLERLGYDGIELADLFHEDIEEASIPDSLRRLGPRLGHVHLADSDRRMPGRGHTDFAAAFAAMGETGYRGWAALECPIGDDPTADLAAGLAVLRAASVGGTVEVQPLAARQRTGSSRARTTPRHGFGRPGR